MTGSRYCESRWRVSPGRWSVQASVVLLGLAGVAASSTPRATIPPSSYQSGLTGTLNPIDNSANLPITGNVTAGKHFRGNIPYNATTGFAAPLGSTSLDSFLRYSAAPDVRTSYPQSYVPFYSPTGTVTTTQPGYQGVFSPVSPRIADGLWQTQTGQGIDSMTMIDASEYRIGSSRHTDAGSLGVDTSPRLRYTPMSTDTGESKDSLLDAPSNLSARTPLPPADDGLMTPQEYQQRLEQLRQNINKMQESLSQLNQDRNPNVVQQPPEPQTSPVMEQLGRPGLELYDPSGHQETLPTPPVETQQAESPSIEQGRPEAVESGATAALRRVEEISKSLDRTTNEQTLPNEPLPQVVAQPAPTKPPAEIPKQTYDRCDPSTQKQFDEHLATARLHLFQGQYDRAANSFRLASAYIPHDPRPYFGRSLAQLAGGDCTGSATSLIRALELDPACARQKIDLVETLGGPDSFVKRITRLQDQVEAGGAPQLQLLLAYVYFQMQQVDEARNTIQAVKQALPSSPAVEALAAAIDSTPAK